MRKRCHHYVAAAWRVAAANIGGFSVMNAAVELVAVTQSAAGTSYNEQQFDATSLLLTPSFPGAGLGGETTARGSCSMLIDCVRWWG